jgi:release factor glutamine methyltransferase
VARLTGPGDPVIADPSHPAEDRPIAMFGGLSITGAPSVLPVRAWTAAQSLWASQLVRGRPDGPILELCGGSAHIGLLAAVLSGRPLVTVDINPDAADCARENAHRAGLAHLVDIRCAGLESALEDDETYPLIIADPPWVPHAEIGRYPEDPPLAIDGGADGMRLARICLRLIDRHLGAEGAAVLQLGSDEQVDQLRQEIAAEGRGLVVAESRRFPRGVLVLLERAA